MIDANMVTPTPDSVPTALPPNPLETTPGESVADISVAPVKSKGGAPKGNRNAIRSGTQAFRNGKWPHGCSFISRQGHVMRRALRAAVVAVHGVLTIWHDAMINSTVIHDQRRML